MTQNNAPRLTIVVIDDEEAIADLIQAILEDEGYHVACFSSTTLAWQQLASGTITAQLVLLDLLMPDETGVAFRQRLHDEPAYARIPVILMSALTVDGVAQLNTFGDDVLFKPFDIDSLLQQVARYAAPFD